jgi:hypothetical protein
LLLGRVSMIYLYYPIGWCYVRGTLDKVLTPL